MAKGKDTKKNEQGKGGDEADARVARLTTHPRASRDLLRAKGWGALLGFALVAWLSHGAGAEPADVVVRALLGGTIGMVVGWVACLTAWRSLASAEIRAANSAYERAVREHAEARERATQAA